MAGTCPPGETMQNGICIPVIDVTGPTSSPNPVDQAPNGTSATGTTAVGIGTGLYGAGIPSAIASAGTAISGGIASAGNAVSTGISNGIGAGFTTLGNYITNAEASAFKTAANWLGRAAFFIFGLVLIIIGLSTIASQSKTVQKTARVGAKFLA